MWGFGFLDGLSILAGELYTLQKKKNFFLHGYMHRAIRVSDYWIDDFQHRLQQASDLLSRAVHGDHDPLLFVLGFGRQTVEHHRSVAAWRCRERRWRRKRACDGILRTVVAEHGKWNEFVEVSVIRIQVYFPITWDYVHG